MAFIAIKHFTKRRDPVQKERYFLEAHNSEYDGDPDLVILKIAEASFKELAEQQQKKKNRTGEYLHQVYKRNRKT